MTSRPWRIGDRRCHSDSCNSKKAEKQQNPDGWVVVGFLKASDLICPLHFRSVFLSRGVVFFGKLQVGPRLAFGHLAFPRPFC